MTRDRRRTNARDILLNIALEAARRGSPGCEDGRREILGSAWLSALSHGDADLSGGPSMEAVIADISRSISPKTQHVDDPRIDPDRIPSWRSSTPFGDAVSAQHARILHAVMDTMPTRLAMLLRLRHGLGSLAPMTFEEIADVLVMDVEDVERGIQSAMRQMRAGLLESRMGSIDGDDEAICQASGPSPFTVSLRRVPEAVATRIFATGVISGTHALVDTPDKAARRAMAAEASERIDPEWLARTETAHRAARQEKLTTAARRRAALAAASATATRVAVDTPTLSVGLKPDADECRFAVYAFDGRGTDGGLALLGGAFLTPEELEARSEDLKNDLMRYRDRKVDGRKSSRVA